MGTSARPTVARRAMPSSAHARTAAHTARKLPSASPLATRAVANLSLRTTSWTAEVSQASPGKKATFENVA